MVNKNNNNNNNNKNNKNNSNNNNNNNNDNSYLSSIFKVADSYVECSMKRWRFNFQHLNLSAQPSIY